MKLNNCIPALLMIVLIVPALFSQQAQRLLNNADIINMVKTKLPESVVVQAIQSNPGKYYTSTNALISLHKAGLTENELNAMITASSKGSGAVPSSSAQTSTPSGPKGRIPQLTETEVGPTQDLHLD